MIGDARYGRHRSYDVDDGRAEALGTSAGSERLSCGRQLISRPSYARKIPGGSAASVAACPDRGTCGGSKCVRASRGARFQPKLHGGMRRMSLWRSASRNRTSSPCNRSSDDSGILAVVRQIRHITEAESEDRVFTVGQRMGSNRSRELEGSLSIRCTSSCGTWFALAVIEHTANTLNDGKAGREA